MIGARLVIFGNEVFPEKTHLVVRDGYRMQAIIQAPADEMVNPGTISFQCVAAGIAIGYVAWQEFMVMSGKIIRGNGLADGNLRQGVVVDKGNCGKIIFRNVVDIVIHFFHVKILAGKYAKCSVLTFNCVVQEYNTVEF